MTAGEGGNEEVSRIVMTAAREFPEIEHHGLIGDRRTGALVANDGSIDWFCAPDFDCPPVFGALLDPDMGGWCRLGPAGFSAGEQCYEANSMVLNTSWPESGLEVSDVMAWPEDERPRAMRRQGVIIRRLRAHMSAEASFELRPRSGFTEAMAIRRLPDGEGVVFRLSEGELGAWTSFPLALSAGRAEASLVLRNGEEHWVALGWSMHEGQCSVLRARELFERSRKYWQGWTNSLDLRCCADRRAAVVRSALTVQALGHAAQDCPVAALTTSLPERMGGDRNYDYRYCWVRDGSLALALLARLGKAGEVERYLHWLCDRKSRMQSPLQVCYRLDGGTHLEVSTLTHLRGYGDSRPVTVGNRAAQQRQLGQLGFFADCARIYFDAGGRWREEFWDLLRRIADYVCEHWQEPDSGIWELQREAHYVASRVMSWVVLTRAVYIAAATGKTEQISRWEKVSQAIHAEVMSLGWCENRGAFRQSYGSDALDAAALLIPLMDFLPVHDRRVKSTLEALEQHLVVDGLMHRFDPKETLGAGELPIGRFEGAFLPCVFWHANVLARSGACDRAEALLRRCEMIAGRVGLFAEEVDAHLNSFLGNTPLVFSHVEYVRAVMALNVMRQLEVESRDP